MIDIVGSSSEQEAERARMARETDRARYPMEMSELDAWEAAVAAGDLVRADEIAAASWQRLAAAIVV